MASKPDIAIVGAGILGASLAWHLARGGARVTLLDSGQPASGATRESWAWINASWGNRLPQFRLRVRAIDEWRRLEREISGLSVAWLASLNWELPPARLAAFVAEHSDWGYDVRPVGPSEIRRIEPAIAKPPELAAFVEGEGVVDPVAATLRFLAATRDGTEVVQIATGVRALIVRANRVRGLQTDSGVITADHVVLAAGAGTAAIARTAGLALPMTNPPALIVHTTPCPAVINGLVMSPAVQARQAKDGRIIAAAAFEGATDDRAAGRAGADSVLTALVQLFMLQGRISLDRYAVAPRPIPRDGLPIVGRTPGLEGLHVAVTHSGVTLAPAIGRFLAAEILRDDSEPLLEPFGLDRLSSNRS